MGEEKVEGSEVYPEKIPHRIPARRIGSSRSRTRRLLPDDANHDYHGMFVLRDPARPGGGRRLEGLHLMDVAPTILGYFGLEPEADVQGKRITW